MFTVTAMKHLLLVSADPTFLEDSLGLILSRYGPAEISVDEAIIAGAELVYVRLPTPQKALERLELLPIDVVLVDALGERGEEALDFVRKVKSRSPATLVIVVARPTVREVVEWMRAGAFHVAREADNHRSRDEIVGKTETALKLAARQVERDSLRERLILSHYDRFIRSRRQHDTRAGRKGQALEDYAEQLFLSISGWQTIDVRITNAYEEVDLVISNESEDPFWRRFGPVILVECKNRTAASNKNDLLSFWAKIEERGACRLGFFISGAGFKRTLKQFLDREAKSEATVVPITKANLDQLLYAPDRNLELKRLVRYTLLGKPNLAEPLKG